MQYALLIYEKPSDIEARKSADETFWGPWRAYNQALIDAGVRVAGEPLKSETTATVVRLRGGERQVQDGPYADTKEQLGGFMLLELSSLDEALEWAARCPAASYGAVEVRPLDDLRHIFGSHASDFAAAPPDTGRDS